MKKIVLVFLMGVILLTLASCISRQGKVEKVYKGEGIFDPSTVENVEINDLIKNPSQFTGNFVSVSGKIVTECSVGCWFYLEDESGNQIHIDLAGNNFNIPQTVGRKVKVSGIFQSGEANTKLAGYEVEYLD